MIIGFNGKNTVVIRNGSNGDIRKVLESCVKDATEQCKKVASFFQGRNERETCHNLYKFLKNNISYIEDNITNQDIKLPGRFLKDKRGDCKSFSLFLAGCLKNLNIPFVFAYASYNPGERQPGHVYVITKSGIIIDPVWHSFNKEKLYSYKYLKEL